MRTFKYRISDPMGLHARPVGFMAKLVSKQDSKVTVEFKSKSADCRRLYQVLALGVQQGDEIKFSIEGNEEARVEKELLELFANENL